MSICTFAASADTAPEPAAPVSASADRILDGARASVVQLRSLYGTATAPASHGTGFMVGKGLLITNYHVVADTILRPQRYRLEYRTESGATGIATTLAIDVVSDLAVVRVDELDAPALPLRADIPVRGERGYSIGFPLDVGLTITEGVNNGLVKDTFHEHLHFSGAINPGMSGGPALDAQGRVFGVNVATDLRGESVGFLVPARAALAILKRAETEPLDVKAAYAEISRQLRAHGNRLTQALLAQPFVTRTSHGFRFPERIAAFVDCSSNGTQRPDWPLQSERVNCSAKAGVYLERGLYPGEVSLEHEILHTKSLGPVRFAARVSQAFGAETMRFGAREKHTRLVCREGLVKLDGMPAKTIVCLRAYRKLTGLYDLLVRAVSVNQPAVALVSGMQVHGVTDQDANLLARRFLEALRWSP